MSKYSRHQSVISRNTDEPSNEDHWLREFEQKLQKGAVQPKSHMSIYDQINSIMNGASSKYPSVQAAVDDMMQRSGLSNYLKTSTIDKQHPQKIATDQNLSFDKSIPLESNEKNDNIPQVMKEYPNIMKTLENHINSTRGNTSVPAVIDKLKSIYRNDVSNDKLWEDDDLIRLVSKLNLVAKQNNPDNYQGYSNLAVSDRDNAQSDVDPSNTDAFHALMTAKVQ